ncbi:MAG: ABC transporter permease [Thermocaproicibacter melissae]|jgi:hypothetical protein|uniref:hypothetical protein n=1 Tax=Thermocaproicibacter melissae TaxID=2966552 RepID=UPI0024B0878B|nr:hypothetical protein [Thermocaproicibacter melissae]WBY64892.1 hypothetical protein NOG13_04165 [Thermocaproicibacter melissae]
MLRKLLRYEIKATQRIFLPIFALILVCSLLIKTFIALNFDDISNTTALPLVITAFVYALSIAASFVMTLVVTIQRFQKNLLGDEGYLSFTLPVKVHSHIDCKMIVSVMWTILSMIVAFVSVLIIVGDKATQDEFMEFWKDLGLLFGNYGGWATLLLIEGIVFLIVSCLSFVLQIYASISVGNFSSKHKLLASFGTFIGFSVVEQIVLSFLIGLDNNNMWIWSLDGPDVIGKLSIFFGIAILYCAVFGVAFYFLTNWILSKKLNLE